MSKTRDRCAPKNVRSAFGVPLVRKTLTLGYPRCFRAAKRGPTAYARLCARQFHCLLTTRSDDIANRYDSSLRRRGPRAAVDDHSAHLALILNHVESDCVALRVNAISSWTVATA